MRDLFLKRSMRQDNQLKKKHSNLKEKARIVNCSIWVIQIHSSLLKEAKSGRPLGEEGGGRFLLNFFNFSLKIPSKHLK